MIEQMNSGLEKQTKLNIIKLSFVFAVAYMWFEMFLLNNDFRSVMGAQFLSEGVFGLTMLIVIFLAASWISGASGFGFSAVGAMGMLILDPIHVVALLMTLSLFTQALSLRALWAEISPHIHGFKHPESVFPYILGGIIFMPAGIYMLLNTPSKTLMLGLGAFLCIYSLYTYFKPVNLKYEAIGPSVPRSFFIGATGGIVGGFSAFPGSAMVVWTGLLDMPKEKIRALTQPYIFVLQVLGIVYFVLMHPEVFDLKFWAILTIALPITYFGNKRGVKGFKNMTKQDFSKLTLAVLFVSGFALICKNIFV